MKPITLTEEEMAERNAKEAARVSTLRAAYMLLVHYGDVMDINVKNMYARINAQETSMIAKMKLQGQIPKMQFRLQRIATATAAMETLWPELELANSLKDVEGETDNG